MQERPDGTRLCPVFKLFLTLSAQRCVESSSFSLWDAAGLFGSREGQAEVSERGGETSGEVEGSKLERI